MRDIVCQAIAERRIIQIFYSVGYRLVEPYCYGISTAGNEVLRGYQLGGVSKSEVHAQWKLFDLSKAKHIKITPVPFEDTRDLYNPNDKAMVEIFCNI